eukprot:15476407-Alexandrium_andersonii.AAC.1
MMWIALMSVPLLRFVSAHQGIPRVLADDWMLATLGDEADSLLENVGDGAHSIIQAMGGRIAPAKSYILATLPAHAKRLKVRLWPGVAATISLVRNTRDLGAHISVGKQRVGTTLTKRLGKAASLARVVAALPRSRKGKGRLVCSKVLPAGLYGADSTP